MCAATVFRFEYRVQILRLRAEPVLAIMVFASAILCVMFMHYAGFGIDELNHLQL